MKERNDFYSRLEHYDFCNLTPRPPFESKTFSFGDDECDPKHIAYIEEYRNIQSLQHRILELDREWRLGAIYRQTKQPRYIHS